MKCILPALVVALVAAALAAPASAQDLFSRERLSNRDYSSTSSGNDIDSRELRRMIERAGYEIKVTHDGDVYEVEVTQEDWTFPVLVELSPDQSNLWVTVVLTEFAGPPEQHAVRMSKLLAVNGKYGNVFFKLESSSQMMMLVGSERNQEMSPSKVDDLILLLTSIAVDTDTLWDTTSEVAPDGPAGLDLDSLVGSWRFSERGRRMEFSFRSNNRFTATFEEDGSSDTFFGTYRVEERDIKLTSDEGEELTLPIVALNNDQLTLNVDGTEFLLTRR